MMKVGWMWFDNDSKRSIEEKVQQAVQHYRTKFGRSPNTCYVNQGAVSGEGLRCGKVKVVAVRSVLPHHFWLGVSSSSPRKGSAE